MSNNFNDLDRYLNEIEVSKENIHQAIINKGGTPIGGLASYADAIENLYCPKTVSLDVHIDENGHKNYNPIDYGGDAFDIVDIHVDVPQTGGGDSKPQIPNGFRFTGGQMIPGQTIFGLYDWSLVYDMTEFFKFVGCTEWDDSIWDDFEKNFNGKCLGANLMFWSCGWMYKAPKLNTVGCLDMSGMFNSCRNLTSIPEYDTSSCLNTSSMFNGCELLTTIPLFNTSNVTDMSYMFYMCKSLTSIPYMDTSNVTTMSNMFVYCESLTTIPELDLSSCTDINHMFDYCTSLTELPHMNTILCTNMYAAFGQCKLLKSISIDTSNTTDMKWCFNGCTSLESIIWTDTSKVTDMNYMLSDCKSLTTIPQMDISNVTTMSYMFNNCYKLGEIRFKGEPKSNVSVSTSMFNNAGNSVENPIFYYDSRYDYSRIINVLPSKWTAVPYDVEEYEATLNQL